MKKDLETTCRECKEHIYIARGGRNDYCLKKEKFVNYKKPCKEYVAFLMKDGTK